MPIARYNRGAVVEQGSLKQNINVQAPSEAFEGSVTPQMVGEIGKAANLFVKQIDDANQLKALTAQNEFKKKVNDFLNNPETGALYTKGEDAIAAGKKYREFVNPLLEDYKKKLSDSQKQYFNQYASATLQSTDNLLNKHVAREALAFDSEQTKSFITNEKNSAIMNFGDEEYVEGAVDRIKQEVVRHADRRGLSAESTKLNVMTVESETRSGVIGQLIDSDNIMTAKSYYDRHKDTILPQHRTKIEKAIDTQFEAQKYQGMSDEIVSNSENYVKALEKANGIGDAIERREVKKLIKGHYNEIESAENQVINDNFIQAANLIEANPGKPARDVIPATKWAEFTPAQRNTLEKRATGAESANNSNKWLDFLELGDKVKGLTREQFETKYWQHFDKAHRTRAENMWTKAQRGDLDAKLSVTNALSHNKMVRNTMVEYGYLSTKKITGKMNAKESEVFSKFEQAYAERLEEFERNELGGKRRALPSEKQKVMDELMTDEVTTVDEGWFWNSTEVKPRFMTDEDITEAGGVNEAKKQFATEDLEQTKNLVLSIHNVTLSEADLVRYYSLRLSGDKKEAEKIINSYKD